MKEDKIFFVILVITSILGVGSGAAEFFVAPEGNDGNPGALAQPFATLQRAQRAARSVRRRESVTISLREGTYYLPETLVLTSADSGTSDAPVLYRAYGDEKAVISGGLRLDLKWEAYRAGIMKARVPASLTTDQLFVNSRRQPMARYPNFDPNQRIFNGYAAEAFSPERARRWADPRGGYIHAMHRHMWGDYHYLITGKKADGSVTYEGGWQNNRQLGMHAKYRFVENIFEELDAPGEWFLDDKTDTLYFYPPGVDMNEALVEAVRLRHLIELRGTPRDPVRFVTFQGLTFRHAARTFMDNKEPLLRSDWTTYRGGAVLVDGTEDCAIEDCHIDQVGGNAVFVNNYNRRITVKGCHISRAGANGVAFVGDPNAARNPLFEYAQRQRYAEIDKTPGPQTQNFPADCRVEDCLIYLSGRVEKQTAPVQITLAQDITVRHCSIYDVPRAGINIGDGCWGGHVIEFCDVFDTVKETGDHGSFNSWGRDRFWGLTDLDLNDDATWEAHKNLPLLDVVKTITLRSNRWRCDHGWDIDLDDGSSNYRVVNNLCLHGGIKNREGFYRVVENNVMVNNGFHPHVWYKHSQDIVRCNITGSDHYHPAGGMPSTPWGKEMDRNLVHRAGVMQPQPAEKLAEQSQRDAHSVIADALFVDPAHGDFRVKDGSPALALGFQNFPMDRFGVQKPELKAIARTPEIPWVQMADSEVSVEQLQTIWQARVRDIAGLGDQSAYGLPAPSGVLLVKVPAGSQGARSGLQKDDVIVACNGKPIKSVSDLKGILAYATTGKLKLEVIRRQRSLSLDLVD
ncbi:MAG: PDZ domain-containing protein [Phycisphaerales bacterium]|nr:MAG: PDZ domain-containing protein [Phycisphaerales bacterium]